VTALDKSGGGDEGRLARRTGRHPCRRLPLFEQVLGKMAADYDMARYLFLTARGYLTGNLIASSISTPASDPVQRQMLVSGMALAVRQRGEAMAEQGGRSRVSGCLLCHNSGPYAPSVGM